MRTPHKQKGLTLIGMIIVVAIVGFFGYAAMRLIPAYTEYFGVVKSLKAVANEPSASTQTIEQLRSSLNANFAIQYVDDSSIPPDSIKLETQGGARKLYIVYDKKIPFLYNVSLLLHFEHAEDLMRSGSGY